MLTMNTEKMVKKTIRKIYSCRHYARHNTKKYSKKWINAIDIKSNPNFTNVKFESSWGRGTLSTCLIGYFNIQNLLLSLACMLEMNYKLPDLISTSIQLQPVFGRMQKN